MVLWVGSKFDGGLGMGICRERVRDGCEYWIAAIAGIFTLNELLLVIVIDTRDSDIYKYHFPIQLHQLRTLY